jgi:hypothetical protein
MSRTYHWWILAVQIGATPDPVGDVCCNVVGGHWLAVSDLTPPPDAVLREHSESVSLNGNQKLSLRSPLRHRHFIWAVENTKVFIHEIISFVET